MNPIKTRIASQKNLKQSGHIDYRFYMEMSLGLIHHNFSCVITPWKSFSGNVSYIQNTSNSIYALEFLFLPQNDSKSKNVFELKIQKLSHELVLFSRQGFDDSFKFKSK